MPSDTALKWLRRIAAKAFTARQIGNIEGGYNINFTYSTMERLIEAVMEERLPVAWEIYKGSIFVTLTRDREVVTRYTERGFQSVGLYR